MQRRRTYDDRSVAKIRTEKLSEMNGQKQPKSVVHAGGEAEMSGRKQPKSIVRAVRPFRKGRRQRVANMAHEASIAALMEHLVEIRKRRISILP